MEKKELEKKLNFLAERLFETDRKTDFQNWDKDYARVFKNSQLLAQALYSRLIIGLDGIDERECIIFKNEISDTIFNVMEIWFIKKTVTNIKNKYVNYLSASLSNTIKKARKNLSSQLKNIKAFDDSSSNDAPSSRNEIAMDFIKAYLSGTNTGFLQHTNRSNSDKDWVGNILTHIWSPAIFILQEAHSYAFIILELLEIISKYQIENCQRYSQKEVCKRSGRSESSYSKTKIRFGATCKKIYDTNKDPIFLSLSILFTAKSESELNKAIYMGLYHE